MTSKNRLAKIFAWVSTLCVAVALSLLFALPASASSPGTPNTDWYTVDPGATTFTISTADELAGLAQLVNSVSGSNFQGRTITLTNDIDLSVYGKDYNNGQGWVPIGDFIRPFSGTFNGGGNVITGLYINRTGENIGLFGVLGVGGTIENLGIEGVNIIGLFRVGGVAGRVLNGIIKNCYTTGTIRGVTYVGGIAGDSLTGTIENCYSTVVVMNPPAGVYLADRKGGIVGNSTNNSIIRNNAALNPSVSGTADIGRVAGANQSSTSTLTNNIAFAGMVLTGTPQNPVGDNHGISRTAEQLQTASGFPIAFTQEPWTYEEGKLPGLGGRTVDMPEHLQIPVPPTGVPGATVYVVATLTFALLSAGLWVIARRKSPVV